MNYKITFNINTFLSNLSQKKKYLKILQNKIDSIRDIKERDYRLFYKEFFLNSKSLQKTNKPVYFMKYRSTVVSYILNITFSQTNTFLHVMDFAGNMKFFYSASAVGYFGKERRYRKNILVELMKLFLKKASFLVNKPIALHLVNVTRYRRRIVKFLKRKLFISIIRVFTTMPYNGCRKRKKKRKKIRTKPLKFFRSTIIKKSEAIKRYEKFQKLRRRKKFGNLKRSKKFQKLRRLKKSGSLKRYEKFQKLQRFKKFGNLKRSKKF